MTRLLLTFLGLICCITAISQPIAFPGAEGYGKYATGGRGGRIIVVTNLNDDGPGSLRDAVAQRGPRIIIFNVSGNIELKTPLRIENDDITIAGQSAPGDGICLKDNPLSISASNVIVRYLRIRLGDKYKHDNDAVSGGRYGQHDVILDHLSSSWSIDECLSIYKTERLTVQWCLVSHSLSKSQHTKGAHGFGGIWGGLNATFHHNLLANHSSRNPRFSSVEGTKNVDFRNNVVYNWGYKAAYGGGRHGEINFVGNYYKPGPASQIRRFLDVAEDGTGRYYVEGNKLVGSHSASQDNWNAVGGKEPLKCKVDKPFPFMPIHEQQPDGAYQSVIQKVGCSLHRDRYDSDVIRQVKKGLGENGDRGIINRPDEVGGWPQLKSQKPQLDSDHDGMPDKWEKRHGLNPNDASDSSSSSIDKDYTNIEVYLNSLI